MGLQRPAKALSIETKVQFRAVAGRRHESAGEESLTKTAPVAHQNRVARSLQDVLEDVVCWKSLIACASRRSSKRQHF
jgi:hypothetical protein